MQRLKLTNDTILRKTKLRSLKVYYLQKGDPQLLDNYRLVSVIPIFGNR